MFSIFKKSIEENIDKSEFEPVLNRLIDLLNESSNIAQAKWVEKTKSALLCNNIADFKRKINSVDMWGGSGAVWEVGGFKTKLNEREFILEIIKLTELMKSSGLKSNAAQSRSKLLKRVIKE
ncbi:hypothetical protein OE09_1567 [Flavobacteriaceae bacterium MAR_2010_72]|nr:hypothetical protein OE09_1567 [Flavobacteriaceae bacterium MAR_2010_72]